MLKEVDIPGSDKLLVGFRSSDDAAVLRLDGEKAIVATVDFITPPVDDPYWFGQIAAANAISDVYVMGGKPLLALNLVMFPSKVLPLSLLQEIMRGAADKVREAGAVLAGGHSIEDDEPKFGLCVVGEVEAGSVVKNRGAEPGDVLILTKPVGTGVLFNSVRSGRLPYGEVEKILPQVGLLNGKAAQILMEGGVRAMTDVTGFGLAGHIFEMVQGEEVTAKVRFSELPLYSRAVEMYGKGETTGSTRENRDFVGEEITLEGLSASEEEILFDPQTSGGIIAAVPPDRADHVVEKLRASGYVHARRVGEFRHRSKTALLVEK